MEKINFLPKFQKINDHWSPKVIAEMNNCQLKLAKVLNLKMGPLNSNKEKCL